MKKSFIFILCIFFTMSLTGCKTKDSYTYEEHYERVKKLIEKNYIKTGYAEYYELHPVYDINDEFLYFVIDFYPSGFCFVKIEDKNIGFICRTMYKANIDPLCNSWENYVLVNGKKKYVYGKKFYRNSPYNISNIENEKRYLIKIGEESDNYFPAIKIGEKYLNLISKKELSIEDLNKVDEIEYMTVEFWFKRDFYL